MTAEDVVDADRRRLFGIAYRMLGDVGEAEDAVQEAYLRWTQTDRTDVDNPAAWMTTVVSRICIDRLRSAQRRRETYIGPWLPEPLLTDDRDPADAAELADSLTLAFLVVLEQLSPLERAAFLLHDVFGHPHGEVAAMLDRTPAAVRQLAARARGRLVDRRPRYERDPRQGEAVARAFVSAVAGGDLDELLAVLAPDVAFVSDGGGLVAAVRHPQQGARRIAQILLGLDRLRPADWTFETRRVNDAPGILVRRGDGAVDSVWVLHLVEGRIAAIDAVRNPEKLRGVARS